MNDNLAAAVHRLDYYFGLTASRFEHERRERAVIAEILSTVNPEPLPALPYIAYPRKMYAEPIHPDLFGEGTMRDLVREVHEKLLAEHARVRRLLPPALPGHEWRAEIAHDVDALGDFAMTDTIRLRYRQVEVTP